MLVEYFQWYFNSPRYNSKCQISFRWWPISTFQFPTVQFKAEVLYLRPPPPPISIPHGTIQRCYQFDSMSIQTISIPHGTIQSIAFIVFNLRRLFQFPTVQFKARLARRKVSRKQFQFPTVQFKARCVALLCICSMHFNSPRYNSKTEAHPCCYGRNLISIPHGTIQRLLSR